MKYIFTGLCIFLITTGGWAQRQRFSYCAEPGPYHVYDKDQYLLKKYCQYKQLCEPFQECITSFVHLTIKDTVGFSFSVTDSCIIGRHFQLLKSRRYTSSSENILGGIYFFGVDFLEFDFYSVNFLKEVEFVNCFFTQETDFSKSNFTEDAYFSGNTFQKKVLFDNASFVRKALFDNAIFNHTISFNAADFDSSATFRGAHFRRVPDFFKTQLPNTLDLRNATLDFDNNITDFQENDKLDFSKTSVTRLRTRTGNPEAKCIILLSGTDVNRLLLPFDRFMIKFDPEDSFEEKVSMYEGLIKSCKDAGMLESAQGWDIEYRQQQNIQRFRQLGYVINFFNETWWNFGYARWRILVIWLPLLFLCFLTYNYWQIERLWSKMYQDVELGGNYRGKAGNSPTPIFKNWQKRFSFTFFYTAVIYFGFKIRHEAVNYNYTRGLLYLYFMYAIGTIHMAFAFSYILSAY
jgi:hypothetical protein